MRSRFGRMVSEHKQNVDEDLKISRDMLLTNIVLTMLCNADIENDTCAMSVNMMPAPCLILSS